MIEVENLSKSFTLHNQSSAVIPVLEGAAFAVAPGECVALTGESGAGKSTVMRILYGNYLAQGGRVSIGGVDLTRAAPREILALRRETLGYVSQFLRVVPRVPTLEWWPSRCWRSGSRTTPPLPAPATCWPGCAFPNGSGRCRPPPFRAENSSG